MRAIPTTAAAVAALWAAGCGSMESPDLATGTVTGRISSASPGAYAYVLGHPDAHAPIAADGSFRIDKVPAGQRTVVLYDGGDGAGTVDVRVEGATISDAPPAGSLPAACSIVAAAALAGAQATGLAFSVDGALLRAADGTPTRQVAGPAAVLFPIPAGNWTWTLRADQPGFVEKAKVMDGGYYAQYYGQSWPVDLSLDVESTGEHPGCASSGCEGSLACDPYSGHCCECYSSADCKSTGASCVDQRCVNPGAAGLTMCQACTDATQCQAGPGGAAAACVVASGTVGYCSYACNPGPCPSGYECASVSGGAGSACLAPTSCLDYYTTYGSSCATDGACKDRLQGGKCWRPDSAVPDSTPGVCSAPCSTNADCPPWLVGWTCDATTQYCRPP